MRYFFFCLLVLTLTGVFSASPAVAQKCDVAQLMVDNPDGYLEWMIDHARKPDAAGTGRVMGRVAVGETIMITAPLPAVGDVIFAATADCKIPNRPNTEIFDIRADSDNGDDDELLEIELGPLTKEMFGYYLLGSIDDAKVAEKVIVAVIPKHGDVKRDNERHVAIEIDVAHDGIKPRWSRKKANEWYAEFPWLVGCNFIPSTAINQLEMWQADTFDPDTIDRELEWAADIGFNTTRVYLHDLLWEDDAEGFQKRMKRYLEIADGHGIKTMFVIFDDCWNHHPQLGKQPDPMPGTHNSGWVQSPSEEIVLDPLKWDRLERYVTELLTAFSGDKRILMWDLYNEPGNQDLEARSYGLVKKTIEWAQAANPSQPLTIGEWNRGSRFTRLNKLQLAASDVLTFHEYNSFDSLKERIQRLKRLGRPLLCTEYMARTRGSRLENLLAVFKWENVGAYNWGLVSGKTNTIYEWDVVLDHEPDPWFHDIFRKDGTPYREWEVRLIQELTNRK